MISIIVATDEDLLIGKEDSSNGMPWNVPEDLKHFKETTLNKTILFWASVSFTSIILWFRLPLNLSVMSFSSSTNLPSTSTSKQDKNSFVNWQFALLFPVISSNVKPE